MPAQSKTAKQNDAEGRQQKSAFHKVTNAVQSLWGTSPHAISAASNQMPFLKLWLPGGSVFCGRRSSDVLSVRHSSLPRATKIDVNPERISESNLFAMARLSVRSAQS